jgi:phosphatidate cytidylyltransferase
MSQLLIRLLTTIIAGIPIVTCTTLGGVFFLILMITLTMLSINEFYVMAQGRTKIYYLGVLANVLAVGIVSSAFLLEAAVFWNHVLTAGFAFGLIALWTYELIRKTPAGFKNEFLLALRSVLYVGFSYAYLVLLRESESGVGLAWMFYLISAIWINDGMAYVFGMRFGKHRLNPEVSPKKSIEGAIAGLLFCTLWSVYLGSVMEIPLFHSIVLGILVSTLAQLGDLTESLLKREMHVKDSGSLLPGHGGVLDRMDSFILTAPVLYYYTLFFKMV